MTHKITLPTFVLTCACALTLTFVGCSADTGDAEFVPGDEQTAEELAEEEEYNEAYEAAMNEEANQ